MKRIVLAAACLAVAGCMHIEVDEAASPATSIADPLADFPQAPPSPPLPTGPLQTIVIASCLNEEWTRDQQILTHMAARKADLAILMGDNVYGSSTPEDPQLSDLRAAYWQQARRREFQALVSSTPTLAVWDDHDFGKNDAGGEDFAYRDLAQAMFDRFWRIGADDPQGHPNGVYGAYQIGPQGQRVQILLLDTRFWRSPLKPSDQRGAPGKERYMPDADPARTVLGAAQWAWLETELKKPADLRLIVSSIQVAAEGHGWERWGNFPLEKQRLYDLIGRTGAKGVVVLSGDRHTAQINRETPAAVGYPVYDFTASAVNMPWGAGAGESLPTLVAGSFQQENYGVVRIDWPGRAVTLELRDKKDAVAFTRTVPFAEIGLK